jgi:hypothetical protein
MFIFCDHAMENDEAKSLQRAFKHFLWICTQRI